MNYFILRHLAFPILVAVTAFWTATAAITLLIAASWATVHGDLHHTLTRATTALTLALTARLLSWWISRDIQETRGWLQS